MSDFMDSLSDLYREQIERYRNRPFLRASMAACALISMADGAVSLRHRTRLDQVLETLQALQVFDPHEGVELFNEFVDSLRDTPRQGRERALKTIEGDLEQDPEQAALLIRICLALCEGPEGIAEPARQEITRLCSHLGVDPEVCGQSAHADTRGR